MMYDAYYTPEYLAEWMVEHVTIMPSVVADFAAGNGSLLRAAARKWPESKILGTDVDWNGLRSIQREVRSVTLGRCDFMNERSRRMCSPLRASKASIPLILLNPPFSCKGGKRFEAELLGRIFSGSLALAFVANAFDYLAPCGQIVAILPASVMQSEKDRELWSAIKEIARVELLGWQGRDVFPQCAARTCIVRISRYKFDVRSRVPPKTADSHASDTALSHPAQVQFLRGTVPTHSLDSHRRLKGLRFIHTTNLRQRALVGPFSTVTKSLKSVRGPAVLLPRVGKPNPEKIVAYLSDRAIVLSDCVIAMQVKSASDALLVQRIFMSHWNDFEVLYHGTGAPYITVRAVEQWLTSTLAKLTSRKRSDGNSGQVPIRFQNSPRAGRIAR